MNLPTTESFVPLTTAPSDGQQREFCAKVIPHGDQTGTFQSLEARAKDVAGATPIAGKLHEPRVTLEREGDRIVSIRVQCTCGQMMDLACVYDDVPKQS